MAIARVGNRGTATGTSPLSGVVSISPSSEVLAGDLIVLMVAALAGVVPTNVNDTQGNEWQVDASLLNTSRVSICSSVVAYELTPADSISLNVGVSLLYGLDLEEFSGIVSPAWKDVTATGSGAGTSVNSGTTSATAQNAELAVAAFAINAAESSFTPGGSYTAFGIVSQVGLGLLGEFLVLAATGTQNATGTAGTTGTWAGAIATYKGGSDIGLLEQRGPDPLLTR